MKLELKHLAPYLPYKLRVKTLKGKGYYIIGLHTNRIDLNHDKYLSCSIFLDNEISPILKPMKYLTKEIEYNNKKITAIVELCKIEDKNLNRILRIDTSIEGSEICYIDNEGEKYYFGYRTEYNSFYFQNKYKQHIEMLHSNKLYEKLYELHFDTFGLIQTGLAVDFNSL